MRAALFAILAASLVGSLPTAASAQSLRCRNDLVSVGEIKAAVIAKCGEPVAKDAYCKEVTRIVGPGATPQPPINTPCVSVDEWTYKPGSGQFMTTLEFESG